MKKKAKETTDAKAFAHKSIEVAAHQLRPAPWNPRPEITSESVADITASLPKVGLIHPLVVMKDPDKPSFKGVDFYLIISGHRRYRACVDAKFYPIPCDLVDVDVEKAKQMTVIENLQRRDVDPLMESELVASLIEGGMSQAEIAAETGRGERWVARRANLVKLSKGWRKRVEKGERFTTDCLEHIAAYPEALQEKLKGVEVYGAGEYRPIAWIDIENEFERESRDLKGAAFKTDRCLSCVNNTGCCPDLFDDLKPGKGAQLGKCLDEKCWRKKDEERVSETVAKAEKKGCTIVNNEPWRCNVYNTTKKPTKKNTTLYVFTDYHGEKVVEWGAPPRKEDDGDSSAAADAKKLEEKRAKRERNKAIRKLAALCAGGEAGEPCNLAKWLDVFFYDKETQRVARHAPFIAQHLFHGLDSYSLVGAVSDMNEAAAAFCLGRFEVPENWSRLIAPSIIRELDPSRCDGFRAVPNARLLCAMFPAEVKREGDGLTEEEFARIVGDDEPLAETEVQWEELDEAEEAVSNEVD